MGRRIARGLAGALAIAGMFPMTVMAEAPGHDGGKNRIAVEELELQTPCIGRVQIEVDDGLHDGVSFDASDAGSAHATIQMKKDQGDSKVVIATKACAPRAVLTVTVASTVSVSIHNSQGTHFVARGQMASLEASLEDGAFDASVLSTADLNLRGDVRVHVGVLQRAAQIMASENASVLVDRADLDAFSAQMADASSLRIEDGRIDALTLVTGGNANVAIGGRLTTAAVTAAGTGQVLIPAPSGPLTRNGTGAVVTGPLPKPPVAASAVSTPPPSTSTATKSSPPAPAPSAESSPPTSSPQAPVPTPPAVQAPVAKAPVAQVPTAPTAQAPIVQTPTAQTPASQAPAAQTPSPPKAAEPATSQTGSEGAAPASVATPAQQPISPPKGSAGATDDPADVSVPPAQSQTGGAPATPAVVPTPDTPKASTPPSKAANENDAATAKPQATPTKSSDDSRRSEGQ
ncbi:hypothetical protein [Brytella acorum]|uniref:Auto-transporter adhesin head GIN domain-containing protein n=1 Tax=Brytella acorum TaxID=2959299 RepID=A0AA35VDE1_9PROT|nr:hypothetical protein [Brytella acorum]MDF3625804.1 hypothetical protein [Brytella acorum]CAI9121233.1 hypothetical protein LMG32879_002080 [Brytella acorum]